ncbi:MAG: hypothetical protein H6Q89_1240 [Myxococcaceae bacterium]|nr:hypothetical protein [Myxococcaceae bacterium]
MSKVARFPEDADRVRAFDQALKKHRSAVTDLVHQHRADWARRKVTMLERTGFPLRPFFLHRQQVDFIASSLHQAFGKLFARLAAHATDKRWLQRNIPLAPGVWDALDVKAGLKADSLRRILRPDGFLYPDKYLLTEINFGNGIIVSNTYTEGVYDFFARSPAFRALGWDVAAGIQRPFLGYTEMIRGLVRPSAGRPQVALLAHSYEWDTILGYPKRVVQQIHYARKRLKAAGIDTVLAHEADLWVDARGRARVKGVPRPVDLVLMITIGTSFMDEPHRLTSDLSHLRGAKVGDVRLAKPLVSLGFDKGTLPFFRAMKLWPRRDGKDFRVEIAPTLYPTPKHVRQLEREQDDWVLKKAFDGKDTHVGVSTAGRLWKRVLDEASRSQEYVAQRYASMPRARMPVLIDDKHLEWLDVRVELSPFIFEGRFGGALARYAPDAEGLVLSPPPEGMGLTTVFTC